MRVRTICLILSVLFTVVACSSQKQVSTYSPPSGMGIRHAGDLVFISNEKIILRYGGEEHSFIITEKTKLLVPIGALKPGDPVSVLTTLEDEKTALDVKRGFIEIPIK